MNGQTMMDEQRSVHDGPADGDALCVRNRTMRGSISTEVTCMAYSLMWWKGHRP